MRPVLEAQTFIRSWKTYSRPVALLCADGKVYIVKGRQNVHGNRDMPRAITNEQIVAELGHLLGAPIPTTALVNLRDDLINSQPDLGHLMPGLAHGCQFLDEITERAGVGYALLGFLLLRREQLLRSTASPK